MWQAALAAIFVVHAGVFGVLARRRRQVRPALLSAGFLLLALAYGLPAALGEAPSWLPALHWTGRGLLVVALVLLVAKHVRARRPA